MPDTPQVLADRLRVEGERIKVFFEQLEPDQWGKVIYPGAPSWNLHDLLTHFVSAEIGRRQLIQDVIDGGKGAPIGFDIDDFNHKEIERLSGESNVFLLELFIRERFQLINLVFVLKAEDLQKVGNDPFLGEVPLVEMIKLTYLHTQIHLRDARRCL
jgi:hypothetical protein